MYHGTLHARYMRLVRFLRARFARKEYLGLHLTIGFVVTLIGVAIFSVLTHDVIRKTEITLFDVRVSDFLHSHGTLFGYGFWAVISSLGGGLTVTILGLGVSILLAFRRRWVVLAGWAAALIGSGLLDGAMKYAIRRPRPDRAIAFLTQQSWSFPSGHSMGSLVTYGMLAYLVVLASKGRRHLQIAAMLGAVLLILSIGFSRLYLNVHYFSDVIGGFSGGALWLSACVTGLEVSRRLKGRTPVEP
ncbi:MAG TPA: phosphatase PAP2 family protein, partial [Gemmatimonadales bacterium]|jgi:undecaprenyl-diphosphatase|nr:phosphatase PAP2 family protein [Gemmatimonadales bacterium]